MRHITLCNKTDDPIIRRDDARHRFVSRLDPRETNPPATPRPRLSLSFSVAVQSPLPLSPGCDERQLKLPSKIHIDNIVFVYTLHVSQLND